MDQLWDAIDGLMSEIVEADEPYRLGLDTMRAALDAGTPKPSPLTHGVYLIWGSLTDGIELHPDQLAHYNSLMRRAADEWLRLANEDDRCAWVDHWVYDECGFARSSPVGGRGKATHTRGEGPA